MPHLCIAVERLIIAANDLLLRRLLTDFVINNTVACHIDAHICWRLVWTVSIDAFKHGGEHRINFNVAVIIYRSFTICFQMKWVDHINIIQISSCGLIG